MSRATPRMRDFAERLIVHETRQNKDSGVSIAVAFPVCEKIRPHLVSLMGAAGFNALLSRAVMLAKAEAPWLSAMRVKADGSLEIPDKLALQIGLEKIAEGGVVLLAQLLGLLVAFIGDSLTLRLVREVWPTLALKDSEPDNGKNNERPT